MGGLLQVEQEIATKRRIISIINIATKCGQSMSLRELSLMLAQNLTEEELLSIIQNDPTYEAQFSFDKGFIVKKGYEHLFSERKLRAKISKQYAQVAELFIKNLVRNNSNVRLVAVCGSVAYGSAKASDDIDLFIIAKKNRLWLVFFKALLLARVYNLKASLVGQNTNFCLSYMQDESEFEKESQRKTALFARELLSSIIFCGKDFYRTLLVRAKWIEGFFPRLTALKLEQKEQQDVCFNHKELLPLLYDSLDMMIYVLLGKYLQLKALMRNLSYRKLERNKDVFEAKITKGSCVYNSFRYKELEKMYRGVS
jgi:predicted nucleotidyltransferase